VPVVGLELDVGHVAIARPQRPHNLLRLVTRVQPVGAEADYQEARLGALERRRQRAVAVGEIEIVHGLGDVQVRVGVEAGDELAAAVAQVTLDLEIHVEVESEGLLPAQPAAELLAHRVVAHERDVAHHARHRQPARRRDLARDHDGPAGMAQVVGVHALEVAAGHVQHSQQPLDHGASGGAPEEVAQVVAGDRRGGADQPDGENDQPQHNHAIMPFSRNHVTASVKACSGGVCGRPSSRMALAGLNHIL